MLIDTHPADEAHLREHWRRKTPAERFARTCELTQIERDTARRAIQQTHPEASPEEVSVLLVERYYDSELASRVREYLKDRSR